MKTKLHVFAWGHAILHVASLVWIKPTTYPKYSPLQLAFGQPTNISHFRIFGWSLSSIPSWLKSLTCCPPTNKRQISLLHIIK